MILIFRMCEIVREKILFKTHEEIPHSVAVILERKEKRGNRMYLLMMVVVDRESQKGILIGKQASMIRSIRLDAQKGIKRYARMQCGFGTLCACRKELA